MTDQFSAYADYAKEVTRKRASLYRDDLSAKLFEVAVLKPHSAGVYGDAFRLGYDGVKAKYNRRNLSHVYYMAGRYRRQLEDDGFLPPWMTP